jgi:hypothetical protein
MLPAYLLGSFGAGYRAQRVNSVVSAGLGNLAPLDFVEREVMAVESKRRIRCLPGTRTVLVFLSDPDEALDRSFSSAT